MIGNYAFGDDIILYKSDGKVYSYNPYGQSITFQCANSSGEFLDGLVEIMKFVKEKTLNNYDEVTRNKRSAEVAYIAALKSGGETNEKFYKTVLWVE